MTAATLPKVAPEVRLMVSEEVEDGACFADLLQRVATDNPQIADFIAQYAGTDKRVAIGMLLVYRLFEAQLTADSTRM